MLREAGSYFEKLKTWHLLIILAIAYGYFGTYGILPLRPQSVHQWAQCDRASVAWNYYNGNADFFHPRVNNTDNGTGMTGLEFPVVQYFVSVLYRLFGFHEWLYRITSLIIFSIGAVSVFRLARYFLKDQLQSLLIMLLYVCSPLLVYYSCSFIPDIYSLSFAMTGWALLVKYAEQPGKVIWWRWFIAMLIACLIKPNSMIHLPVMGYFLFNSGLWSLKDPLRYVGYFVVIVALTLSWYFYASWLSRNTGSEVFLLQMRPPSNMQDVKDVWERVRLDWLERIYFPLFLKLIVVVGLGWMVIDRPFRNPLATYTLFLFLAAVVFLYLMFLQLAYHDYYFITMFPALVFILIFLLAGISKRIGMKGRYVLYAVTILFLLKQAHFAHGILQFAHKKDSWMYGAPQNDKYFNSDYFLKAAGIDPDDQVISIFDPSPNITLYLMGRKGVTIPYRKVAETLMGYLQTGRYKYVVYNSSDPTTVTFSPGDFPLVPVLDTNGIRVFAVSSSFHPDGRTVSLSPWN